MKLAFAIWVTVSAIVAAYRLVTFWWLQKPLDFPIMGCGVIGMFFVIVYMWTDWLQ
jgi:hypothetical protein